MATAPPDAALVHAARSGDRAAFAAVYDRYADRIHDFCRSQLRDRDEAADATQDTFVIAAQRLGQLRDPARLRPWLYAIARSQVLRRFRARRRVDAGAEVTDVADPAPGPDRQAERADLRSLLDDAAEGLAERDRLLLDLHLRHGLEGQELGDAVGVPGAHANVLLHRLRAQVERSLGALLVARLGSEDCAELRGVLAGWDGRFSPLLRKRVARHVDACPTCDARRRTALTPAALLSAAPLAAAPTALRTRVLDAIDLDGSVPPSGPDGPGTGATGGWSPGRVAALAGVAVVVVAVVLALLWREPEPAAVVVAPEGPGASELFVAPSPSASASAFEPGATPSVPPTAAGEAVTGAPEVVASPPAAPAGPALVLSDAVLDLGAGAGSGDVVLGNDGGGAAAWTAVGEAPWVTVAPAAGTLAPAGTVALTVDADRGALPEGPATTRVRVAAEGTAATLEVVLVVANPPEVGPVTVNPPAIAAAGCTPDRASVRAVVTDDTGVAGVELRWSGAATGSAPMAQRGDWFGSAGPVDAPGTLTLTVAATDSFGNTGVSDPVTLTVRPCRAAP